MHLRKTLQTDRLKLMAYREKDIIPFHDLLIANENHLIDSFPNLLKWCKDEKACADFMHSQIEMWETKTKVAYGIFHKKDKKLIGHSFLKNIDWKIPKCEAGYWIDQNYQGQGLTTETMQMLTQYAFETLKMNKIYLRIFPDNWGSKKVALKLGFELEGCLRNEFIRGGTTLSDIEYYGRIK